MADKTVTVSRVKETKNTVQYSGGVVTPIYVSKSALPEPFPEEFKVTLHLGGDSEEAE